MALWYASAGVHVFPVNANKEPLTEHGFHDASRERAQVEEMWRRHPDAGIATADFDVIDVDLYKPDCSPTWRKIKGLIPPGTPQTKTGGGGLQFFFQPGTLKDGKIGPGVDSRYAGRNYVVLPPSMHPSGNRYEAIVNVVIRKPPPAPDFPHESGSNSEFKQLLLQMDSGEKISDGRNKAAWWRAVEILRTLPPTIELSPVETLVQTWVNENCGGDLAAVNVRKQVQGAAVFVTRERAGAATLEQPRHEGPPRSLDEVVAAFRKWLHLPDLGALYVALAAVVANRLPGDPLWLLLVAASSSGKTEILFSLSGLDEVVAAATMTEAALLSGTPRRDRSSGASGGLLVSIGDYGILTLKDFGSILSLRHETRAGVLAALREIYDGSWDRPVGVDGGRVLHWHGKLGLIAGVTTVVDSHHAVMDSLGSRFAFYRVEVDERDVQAGRALEHRISAQTMRAELREAVTGFFAGLALPDRDTLGEDDRKRLVTLADLVTMARSPIERDRATREIELVPDPEAPARFTLMLAGLLEGLRVIGLDDDEAWRLVTKTAFDSMPALRRRTLERLAKAEHTTTREVAVMLGLPTTTVRRTLEDLAAHGVLEREIGGEGKADHWRLATWTRERYNRSRNVSLGL
jgi:hypothetical protein